MTETADILPCKTQNIIEYLLVILLPVHLELTIRTSLLQGIDIVLFNLVISEIRPVRPIHAFRHPALPDFIGKERQHTLLTLPEYPGKMY